MGGGGKMMMERIESSIRRCPVSRFLLSPRSLHLSSSFSSTRHPLPLRLSPYSRLVLVKDSKEIEKKNLLPAKKVRQGEGSKGSKEEEESRIAKVVLLSPKMEQL